MINLQPTDENFTVVSTSAIDSLKRMVEELEKDAARYRTKRRIDHDKMIASLKTDDSELMMVASIGFNASYDAAIDAAMSKE